MYLYKNIETGVDGYGKKSRNSLIEMSEFLTQKNAPYRGAELLALKDGDSEDYLEPEYTVRKRVPLAVWRKANTIHNWFVENVQEGEDDCQEYSVEIEQIEDLRDLCARVIANPDKADEILPTRDGFFFGDTDYSEYYMDTIRETEDKLSEIIKQHEEYEEILDKENSGVIIPLVSVTYTYRSSW